MVEVRRAVAADLPEIHRIWWATGSSPGKQNPWFAHVLRTGVVAVAIDDGEVVGFAGHRMVWQTNVVSDCFVDPSRQGMGIGTRILAYLLPDDGPVMTLASDDPKAHSLYSKWGMKPVVECPYMHARANGSADLVEIDSFPIAHRRSPPPSERPRLSVCPGRREPGGHQPELDRVILDRPR
ncbi:MAG: GNAT family N-acetyltransferase [Acidimicrobiia bacterium]